MIDPLECKALWRALANHCHSDLGALAALATAPAPTRAAAEARLDRLDEASALDTHSLLPPVTSRLELGQAPMMAQRGAMLDGDDLRRIGRVLRCGCDVHDDADGWRPWAPSLAALADAMPAPYEVADDLIDTFDEHGEIRDDASVALARLRSEVRTTHQTMRRRVAELVRENDAQGVLQDDYYTIRQDRFVLPVRAAEKRTIEGIIHGSSQTGATVYLEPAELVAQNNRLALAVEAVRAEERRILLALSGRVGELADALAVVVATLVDLDTLSATARFCRELSAHRALFRDDAHLELHGARHPHLALAGDGVVANDVILDGPRWMIVSGPNGGGKTVTLTTVGVAVEMARCGLYVCAAEGSIVPWVDDVDVILGDGQDLGRGLSTFAGHLQRLREVLERARGPGRRLILIDELASGTEPAAGSALARAILLTLAETTSIGLVTTHDEAVKLLAVADPRFANSALELDRTAGTPTFLLRLGAIGSSSPLALAARLGLPQDVLERAHALLGGAGLETAALLERLESMRRELAADLQTQRSARNQLDDARQRLEQQRQHEKRTADRRIADAAQAGLAEIEQALESARAARKSLATADAPVEKLSRQIAAQQRILRASVDAHAADATASQPARAAVVAARLVPGAEVFHVGLGRVVTVVEVDERRGEARVTAGALEIRAALDDLRAAQGNDARALPRARKPAEDAVMTLGGASYGGGGGGGGGGKPGKHDHRPGGAQAQRTDHAAATDAPSIESDEQDALAFRNEDRRIDLRGMRVEEAIERVDAGIDAAVVRGIAGVTVVHGMGTGALRRAIEQHLRNHAQVRRHRIGGAGEGGAGATMVWLHVQ